jgi:integrase
VTELEPRPAEAAVPTDPNAVLSPAALDRLDRSVPDNTKTAYRRQARDFVRWCEERERDTIPATAQTLADYVSHLCDQDKAPSTIEQAIATIRVAHREAGHDGQPDTRAALRILKTHKRDRAEAGKRKRQSAPVTLDPLRKMIDATDPATLAGQRDRTLLVIGFAMMARRSELAALHISDLTFTDDGITVLIRKSKTDQGADGAEVNIPHGVHPDTDPIRVARAWLASLAEHGITDGPLLRRINRWGQLQPGGMSGWSINERVKHLAKSAGLPNADAFTAHGIRAGGPTEAAKAGQPVAFIADHGRWSKTSPQVMEYIRTVDKWRDNPMRGIGL